MAPQTKGSGTPQTGLQAVATTPQAGASVFPQTGGSGSLLSGL